MSAQILYLPWCEPKPEVPPIQKCDDWLHCWDWKLWDKNMGWPDGDAVKEF